MRILKKLLISAIITLTLSFGILVALAYIYQEGILSSLQNKLNDHLNAEIKVGRINLSFITDFPNASINFKHVVAMESKDYSAYPDTLFRLESLALSFNLWDIFNGHYKLNEIKARTGFINLEISQTRQPNYLIYIPDDDSSKSAFELNINQIRLVDVEIDFNDFTRPNRYGIYFTNTKANVAFINQKIKMALNGSIEVKKMSIAHTEYLTNENVDVDVELLIDNLVGTFEIKKGYLTFRNQYAFEIKGTKDAVHYHYALIAKGINIHKLRDLIPITYLNAIAKYDIDGDLTMHIDVKDNNQKKHQSFKVTLKYIQLILHIQYPIKPHKLIIS